MRQREDNIVRLDETAQFFGIGYRRRHRFIADDVEPCFDEGFGDIKMHVIRSHD